MWLFWAQLSNPETALTPYLFWVLFVAISGTWAYLIQVRGVAKTATFRI